MPATGMTPVDSWEALVVIFGLAMVAWGFSSAALARRSITPAIVLTAAGAILFSSQLDAARFEVRSEAVRTLAEIALAIVLFNDAAHLSLRTLRSIRGLALRLLGIGLPLTLAISFGAAWLLFPRSGLWACFLVAACTSPTDAALGAPIMVDERIPTEIRDALNVESGLNDGLCTPIVNFALAGAVAAAGGSSEWQIEPLEQLAVGLIVGGLVGVAGGRLLSTSKRRGWGSPDVLALTTPVLALISFGLATELSGNGFVAAFVGGIAFASQLHPADRPELEFSERVGAFLSLVVWFVVGAVLIQVLRDVTWQAIAYAAAALTVARMLPVAIGLIGSGTDRAMTVLVGWFEPRGLASVVFAVLALNSLPAEVGDAVAVPVLATVIASVVAHGLTSVPLVDVLVARRRPRAAA